MENKIKNASCNVGLEYYDKKPNEPESSVMGSLDYNFSTFHYPEGSPLKNFVDAYISAAKDNLCLEVFNCRFERPRSNSNFVNFYIYLLGVEPNALDIHYRIENSSHDLIKIFYEVLKRNELPAINTDIKLQFLVKNFENNSRGRAIYFAWHDIHREIQSVFPNVVSLSNWSVFYVFIEEVAFESVIANVEYLKRIKEYCYKATKKHDIDGVWNSDNFSIRVDNWKHYNAIGGQHYFNSDSMFECMML